MAVTTTAMSAVDATIEVSVNGTTWTDLSGSANSVEPGEQTRMTGVAYVFEGDVGIVTSGKREPLEITVSALYTETAGETFETVRSLFEAGTRLFFRYSPQGVGATGRAVYTASNDGTTAGAVVITTLSWPTAEAETADPVAISFQVMAPAMIRTTTGSSTGLGSGA
jgi:hypothetical protein